MMKKYLKLLGCTAVLTGGVCSMPGADNLLTVREAEVGEASKVIRIPLIIYSIRPLIKKSCAFPAKYFDHGLIKFSRGMR